MMGTKTRSFTPTGPDRLWVADITYPSLQSPSRSRTQAPYDYQFLEPSVRVKGAGTKLGRNKVREWSACFILL